MAAPTTRRTVHSPERKSFMNEALPESRANASRGPGTDAEVENDDGTRPRDPENPERPAEEPEEWQRSVGPSSDSSKPSDPNALPGRQNPRSNDKNFPRP